MSKSLSAKVIVRKHSEPIALPGPQSSTAQWRFYDDVLYKSTFYLLTYSLTGTANISEG